MSVRRGRVGIIDRMRRSHQRAARTTRRGWALVVCALVAASTAPAQAGQAATGSIAGRLIDVSTGQPIAGGVLVLRDVMSRSQTVVTSDPAGVFHLEDLAAADYSLHATALGYVPHTYGQRYPTEVVAPITVAGGEAVANIEVALTPTRAIAGRVTTANGQPLAFADVEVLRPQLDGDQRVLQPVGQATSNARGEYRVEGLPPGLYYVAAQEPDDPGTDDAAAPVQTMPIFFPGVATPAAAERVRVSAGDDLTDVNFPVVRVAGVMVRGRLEQPRRTRLATGSVIMSPEANAGLGLGVSRSAIVRPDGKFEFSNVPPGLYGVRASARTTRDQVLFGASPLAVGRTDVGDVEVELSPGARLSGVVEAASTATSPVPSLDGLWVSAPMFDGTIDSGVSRSRVDPDGGFILETPEGRRIMRLDELPAPWSLQSVSFDGRNVLDTPFDLQLHDTREGIRLLITDRPSRLTGSVRDEQGRAVRDPAVVALPVDPTRRYPGSPHVQLTYPDRDGRYELIGLPAGDYLLSVVTGIREDDLYDVRVFREIAAVGTAVTIEGATRSTRDLTFSRR